MQMEVQRYQVFEPCPLRFLLLVFAVVDLARQDWSFMLLVFAVADLAQQDWSFMLLVFAVTDLVQPDWRFQVFTVAIADPAQLDWHFLVFAVADFVQFVSILILMFADCTSAIWSIVTFDF